MELETFYNEFELIAEAPNGIEKLREMILQLAVQGNLVLQDQKDEPASVLLERVMREKQKLIKDGVIKRATKLSSIDPEEIQYGLPDNWCWARLGNLCVLENGDRSKNYPNKSALIESGIPFINAGHMKNGRVDI